VYYDNAIIATMTTFEKRRTNVRQPFDFGGALHLVAARHHDPIDFRVDQILYIKCVVVIVMIVRIVVIIIVDI
jgi:hypothetical protein